MRVGDIAVGRAGDKGGVVDFTIVALDEPSYRLLEEKLTEHIAATALARAMPGRVKRYEVPCVHALKFVVADALPGGVYATLHAGLHWQKSAISILLDLEI